MSGSTPVDQATADLRSLTLTGVAEGAKEEGKASLKKYS
jgi:hypothetical protein